MNVPFSRQHHCFVPNVMKKRNAFEKLKKENRSKLPIRSKTLSETCFEINKRQLSTLNRLHQKKTEKKNSHYQIVKPTYSSLEKSTRNVYDV